mgnify:CR=1 FL=1
MDSKQLYQEVILDHNRKPRNYGRLEQPTHSSEGLNPLCGDHIWLHLHVKDGTIEGVAFEGQSCAICKASASMMTSMVKSKRVEDAEALVAEFRGMVTGTLDTATQPHHLGRLAVFAGVKDLPSRVKCAVLPWHTLHAALASQETASTEGDQDPLGTAGA